MSESDIMRYIPSQQVDESVILEYTVNDLPRLIWIGHASFLLQIGGFTILTDPIWSQYASPLQTTGPQRCNPPPFQLTAAVLNKIDAVIISHNHYDHLDYATAEIIGNHASWFVPLGVGPLISRFTSRITELDWWQTSTMIHVNNTQSIAITLTPAKHWSFRLNESERNSTLWGSFVLEISEFDSIFRVFFAGDTAFDVRLFESIHSKFPSFNLGLIPIGAYKPRWMMCPQHVNPSEAVEIHKLLNCNQSIGMHWGTFSLCQEYMLDPVLSLCCARQNMRNFFTLTVGQVWPVGSESSTNLYISPLAPVGYYSGDLQAHFPNLVNDFGAKLQQEEENI